jgi:chromate reductase
MKIVGLCGSLRRSSANLKLLELAAALAPEVEVWLGIGGLPHFNADLEEPAPDAVREFRARLAAADAVLISTPEYAHSIPGVLKNAIDWVVSSGELNTKTVGVIAGGEGAAQAIRQVLGAVDARVPDGAFAVVRPGKQPINDEHRAQVAAVMKALRAGAACSPAQP